MTCHLSHKIPWANLGDALTVYRGAVSLPVGDCGRIHCNDRATQIKIQNRHRYIRDDCICYDIECKTTGVDTFSKQQVQSHDIDSSKFLPTQFQINKIGYFCRKFVSVLNEFANTATIVNEPISNDYLKKCDLSEFVDRAVECPRCYGCCRSKEVCHDYVVFCLFVSGRMDVLVRLHELGRIDVEEALRKNYGGQAVGNGYSFLVEAHLIPFYLLSNVILQCDFQNDKSKWASLNPEKHYSLYNRLLEDCDFKTFIPHLRHSLDQSVFMKDHKATHILLKETFRCIYQYIYLREKFLGRNPIDDMDILNYIRIYFNFPYTLIESVNKNKSQMT